MRKFKVIIMIIIISITIIFDYRIINAKPYVKTDYIHDFKQDINNLIDDNENTYFELPDFINYLEFKIESNKRVKKIKFVVDSVKNEYEYKVYSSSNGYEYNSVDFKKVIISDNEEELNLDIKDKFIRIKILSSKSEDFINIKEIYFIDKNKAKIDNVVIEKDNPDIEEIKFQDVDLNYKDSIKGLIIRTLGEYYVDFFKVNIVPNIYGNDYFELHMDDDKIIINGNNVNSLAVGLNYYFEHYLNQTFSRFGNSKIEVKLPMKRVEGRVRKEIDVKYRYNYNYVAFGYTMAYWDFDKWEREIDWMALNGFNLALNLVGHEEVIRRTLNEFGFSFTEIVEYLTSPIYLPWMYMGNISRIGGEITPKWFEDRAKLAIKIRNRMNDFGISQVQQIYIGQFPFKENLDINVLPGSYWSRIKGSDRLNFYDGNYEKVGKVFYEKQREVMGDSNYFAGDLFHEGGNFYGYDVKSVAYKILDILKKNNGVDSIWVMQSWNHNPTSELIEYLDKKNLLIIDLHSQLNVRWKGSSKFNGMSWTSKEFNSSNWVFGILNNFGGRSGLYGHFRNVIDEFYNAKNNAEYLKGIGSTPEAIGYNDFIDELTSELIFSDRIDEEEFVKRYITNRYGKYSKKLLDGFYVLLDTVYNPTINEYHEGASESVINARPSMDITSSSKWGKIHKNYNSDILERALNHYYSVYDEFKDNQLYINDLTEISSEVIVNLAYDYYDDIKTAYRNNNFNELKMLSEKFLYLINLQANILYYNDRKSLSSIFRDIEEFNYDDYFEDTLKYNKKTILTTWYDKLVSEDDGLRDYANTDFYELIGNLYYNRWKNYFDELLSNGKVDKDKYDDYKFDLKWIYNDNSLKFNKSNKNLKELLDLLIVDASAKKSKFSFLFNIIYSIGALFR